MKKPIQVRSYVLGISVTTALFYVDQGKVVGFTLSMILMLISAVTLQYGLPSERVEEQSEASVEEVELEVVGSK